MAVALLGRRIGLWIVSLTAPLAIILMAYAYVPLSSRTQELLLVSFGAYLLVLAVVGAVSYLKLLHPCWQFLLDLRESLKAVLDPESLALQRSQRRSGTWAERVARHLLLR
jgi:hypothetical protein